MICKLPTKINIILFASYSLMWFGTKSDRDLRDERSMPLVREDEEENYIVSLEAQPLIE